MEELLKDILIAEMSSSSSFDSSDEEYDEFSQILFGREDSHRVQNFVENVVNKYSELEFRQNFRVSRSTAEILIEQYRNSYYFKTKKCGGRQEISAEVQVLAFLWFAGNKETYRGVSNLFNMSKSSVHRHIGDVVDFLFEISPNYIKCPVTEEEKIEKTHGFSQLAGIQNVIGCIDGCYIYIRKPTNKIASTYVNRHGLLSTTLQAICDAETKFVDICIGSPSKIHDARIFKFSYISPDLPTICGDKYHILGDSAYQLRQFLLTPYKDYGSLTNKQKIYNRKHCQTRVKIENSFGLLKQRFRQLICLDFFGIEKVCKFIMGCCVLHNMCIDQCDLWELDENVDMSQETSPIVTPYENSRLLSDAVLKHLGELKRNQITNNLN